MWRKGVWRLLLGTTVALGYSVADAERRYTPTLPNITWVGAHINHAAESADIEAALSNVIRFADANHLQAGIVGLRLKAIKVFGTKDTFDEALIRADGLQDGTTLPPTFVGVVDGGVLYA